MGAKADLLERMVISCEYLPLDKGEFQSVLRYNENVIAVDAQIERRGDAWPVRGLLGGKDLTGRLVVRSPRSATRRRRAADGRP